MKYIAVVLGIFGIELGIKEYIEKNKTEGSSEQKLFGALLIRKHHNKGMLLNAGENRQGAVMLLSVLLSMVATAVFVMTLGHAGGGLLKWGLALLLGGAYSNTYDRVKKGFVTDYLNFPKMPGKIKNIVFNISDFCILIGTLLVVLKTEHF